MTGSKVIRTNLSVSMFGVVSLRFDLIFPQFSTFIRNYRQFFSTENARIAGRGEATVKCVPRPFSLSRSPRKISSHEKKTSFGIPGPPLKCNTKPGKRKRLRVSYLSARDNVFFLDRDMWAKPPLPFCSALFPPFINWDGA